MQYKGVTTSAGIVQRNSGLRDLVSMSSSTALHPTAVEAAIKFNPHSGCTEGQGFPTVADLACFGQAMDLSRSLK